MLHEDKNITRKTRIAILASGTGSNTLKIIQYFKDHQTVCAVVIISNNKNAGVLKIAEENKISTIVINRETFENGIIPILEQYEVDFIILAGFLWKIPANLIGSYPEKIINIHPALLPKYGGKGMYGNHVHEKVIQNQELQSGITIHVVDEIYDNGEILFQASCNSSNFSKGEDLATEIHKLEHIHFPVVIESYIRSFNEKHKKTRS